MPPPPCNGSAYYPTRSRLLALLEYFPTVTILHTWRHRYDGPDGGTAPGMAAAARAGARDAVAGPWLGKILQLRQLDSDP